MNIRKGSFMLLITIVILSQAVASRFLDEADEDEQLMEAWNPLKKIAHRNCYPKTQCETAGGKKTCKDFSCCQIVLFGKKTRAKCTVVTS
ncbi:strongylocin 2-like [Strongylocentrotus purpuratus]|uniref:Uncharacterized protein n=1 Tax=Strongylocentrotus purpuratus TaxID=7668 RepID=A0A7M7GGM5_STRPU|nr:strongylocin 2-like [Strongylocentrotus purpuratus]|eukprot:XP_003725077.1 PREDICTED: uncharacterized protein LOC100893214 isoform X1 [Strongylocentrotus purpuratus]